MGDKLLLKVDEVARTLSLGRTKVVNMIMAGQLPSVKIGRARRVSVDALEDWIRSQQTPNVKDGQQECEP